MKRLRLPLKVWSIPALAFCLVALWLAIPAAAQTTQPPDMTQFGFPKVTGSATFTPGQAVTITAGTQMAVLPADFISKTVKFEFLEGDPALWAANLGAAQGMDVVATFAFRVTDPATGQLVGRFDKPVAWSVTDPRITSDSKVYNASAANPPVVTPNSSPGTLQGNTLSHPFGGAGVGWLVLNPAAPAAATPTAVAVPTSAPTEVVAPSPTEVATPIAIGMPTTGGGTSSTTLPVLLVSLLAGAVALSSGFAFRMRARRGR
jgi:hypothetical protein